MAASPSIPNADLLRLDEGLRSLDATRESKDEIVILEFKPKTVYALMRASVAATRAKAALDLADRKLMTTHGVFEGMIVRWAPEQKPTAEQMLEAAENAKKLHAYGTARMELLAQECELDGIIKIHLEDLFVRPDDGSKKVKRNPISTSVIAKLAPILADE